MNQAGSGIELDVRAVRDLVAFEYRSMVIRQLQITVEWQQIEWLDFAACRSGQPAARDTCGVCPVRAECLSAALATDDEAEWRGGVSRDERGELWQALEGAFVTLRDRDFMQLDRLVDGRGIT